MSRILLFLLFLLPFSPQLLANEKDPQQVAKVLILRGQVKAKNVEEDAGKDLKLGDWLKEGTLVQTGKQSFIKLIFKDNSQLGLGPESKMVIHKFPKESAGLISLVQGQIRAQVTKTHLQEKEGDNTKQETKLYIKTKTAAMGIRGTDFQAVFNQENQVTSLVTFEGEVAMVATRGDLESAATISPQVLEKALNSPDAVSVKEGQYSGANPSADKVSLPVKISPAQMESLKSNKDLDTPSETSDKKKFSSPTPPGISPKAVASTGGSLEKQLTAGGEIKTTTTPSEQTSSPPEGKIDNSRGTILPPAGGFVDIKTGLYIPPPPGSTFDQNTGVYVPPSGAGGFDAKTGHYLPPSGLKLEASGILSENKVKIPESGGGNRAPAANVVKNTIPTTAIAFTGNNFVSPSVPLVIDASSGTVRTTYSQSPTSVSSATKTSSTATAIAPPSTSEIISGVLSDINRGIKETPPVPVTNTTSSLRINIVIPK